MDNKIKNQIFWVINKTIFKEKKRIFKFKNVSLYPSEDHLLPAIENTIQTNTSEITKQFSLPKGTISQTLSRLKKKASSQKQKIRRYTLVSILNHRTYKSEHLTIESEIHIFI